MTGWPWPIDGVQSWFESLWNGVLDWVNDAATTVTTYVWDKILWVKDRIFEGLTWVREQLFGLDPSAYWSYWIIHVDRNVAEGREWFIGVPGTWWWGYTIERFKEELPQHVPASPFNILASLAKPLLDWFGWLRDRLGEGWAYISNYVTEKVDWLWARLQDISHWMSEQFVTLNPDLYVAFWTSHVDKNVREGRDWFLGLPGTWWWGYDAQRFKDELPQHAPASPLNILATISKPLWDGIGWVRDRFGDGITWVGDRLNEIVPAMQLHFINAFETVAATIGNAVGTGIGAVVDFVKDRIIPFTTYLFSVVRDKIVTPALTAIQPLIDDITFYFKTGMDSFLELLISPGHKTPEAAYAEVPTLFLQTTALGVGVAGILSVAQTEILANKLDLSPLVTQVGPLIPSAMVANAYIGMALQVGYVTPLRYYYNKQFTPLIPGIRDLIQFVVREVITPDDFTNYAAYEGYSSDWAKSYWDAHWVLPPLDRVYDAFHRGLVDEKFVRSFLVLADYADKYHDLLLGTIYTLIPRIDLRYGWETGTLSDEDLVRILRTHGFNKDDAEAEATIQKRRVLESELEATRRETVTDYIDGFIDEDTLSANLWATGLRVELVAYRVSAAKLRRTRQERKEQIGLAKVEFLRGSYAVSDAISDLVEIGLTKEEATSEVTAWRVLAKPARTVAAKKPGDEVTAQITLVAQYINYIAPDITSYGERGADIIIARTQIGDAEDWLNRATTELKAERYGVAMDMARFAETIAKAAETSLRAAVVKYLGG